MRELKIRLVLHASQHVSNGSAKPMTSRNYLHSMIRPLSRLDRLLRPYCSALSGDN